MWFSTMQENSKMKKKAILLTGFTALSLLMALGLFNVCDCMRVSSARTEATAATVSTEPSAGDFKVVAYYFHGTYRCTTCRNIESFAREAVQTGYGEALKAGRLEWRAVNVEEPANRHFIKDYQLYTRSVVLASYQGEKQLRWKNLDQVWVLVGKKPQFVQYVQAEVNSFLETR
jgi:hypothetical protein